MRIIILAMLLGLSHEFFCQGQRQIQSRKIKEVVSATSENKKGTIVKKTTVTQYDRKGRPSLIQIFESDSICISREFFTYKKNGDLLSRTLMKGTSDYVIDKEEIFYDKWNRDTLVVEWQENKVKTKTRIVYDNMDNKIMETTHDNNDLLLKTSSFIYDKKGMLLEKLTVDDKGQILYKKQNQYTY